MPSWTAKDPDAVLDYLFTIPLDDGDSVSTHTFSKVSGDVGVDSESRSGAEVTVWLSGGTAGETAVFKCEWTTAAGREDERTIDLHVLENQLDYTDQVKPTESDLIARFPAFASVAGATIRYWLDEAGRIVSTGWIESDYAPAIMELAAHNMALLGLESGTNAVTIPAGVTRFRSGSLDMAVSEAQAKAGAEGSFKATVYGRMFIARLQRNRGGPIAATSPAPSKLGYWPQP